MDDFRDAALVLLGHGSTLNADSSGPTHLHAEALRRRGLFAQVLAGFWKEHPFFSAVLRGAFAPRVFVVPLFIGEGYFTEEVIPRELGFAVAGQADFPRVRDRDGQRLHYCGPVGTHPGMGSVITTRAREAVAGAHPAPEPRATSLFVVGHGTGNNENSRRAVEDQAARLRAAGEYREVRAAFMEEDPRVSDVHAIAESEDVVVVPFFISDGLHSREDIPVLLGDSPEAVRERLRRGDPTWINPTLRRGRRIWYSRSVGDEPLLAEVILQRAREAASAAAVSPPPEPASADAPGPAAR
jgi:sirohydrochlorin cobaltochelatase